jgi:ABC-type iron transport system FetAB ATPase subunit
MWWTGRRIDAGFHSAALLAGFEARNIDYVSRLKANRVLDRLTAPHMVRLVRPEASDATDLAARTALPSGKLGQTAPRGSGCERAGGRSAA